MKKTILFFLVSFIAITGSTQNTMSSAAKTGTNTVTGTTYDDVMSSDIALNVISGDAILVYATFSSHLVFQSGTYREAIYRLTEDGVATAATSGEIERKHLTTSADKDYGIGSMVHVFTAGSSGTTAVNLSHKTGSSNKDITTDANLIAVNIGDQPYEHISQTTTSSTSSGSFQEVAKTNTISPDDAGGFLILGALEISGNTSGVSAEWKIQYTDDNGSSWDDIGNSASRTVSSSNDIGIVNLMASLPDNTSAGSYEFRVVHKADGTNTINTNKCYLTVVSLADANNSGYYYPIATTNSSSGASTTNTNTFQEVLSGSIFPTSATMDVLMASYYNMSGSDQINEPQFKLEMINESGGSNPTQTHLAQTRFIKDGSDIGSGASVGLAEGLSSSTDYSIKLKHKSNNGDGAGTNELTTYNVGLKALGLTSTNAAAGTFPVELLNFYANYSNGKLQLHWTTASETNNDYFEILLSADGNEHTPVAVVSGAGNSNQVQEYEHTLNSNISVGYIYLKQVDYNGKFNIHGPVLIEDESSAIETTVFPNPVHDKFAIEFSEPLKIQQTIRLYNISGKVVYEHLCEPGDSKIDLNIQSIGLTQGVYFLRSDGNSDLNKKIILK